MLNLESDIGSEMKAVKYIYLLLILLPACQDDPCLKGSGNHTESIRNLPAAIESISLYDNLSITIHPDTGNYIRIRAGENLIPLIVTETDNGNLILRNDNKCRFLRGFDFDICVDLHIREFSKLYYYGYGNVVMRDTLRVKNFMLKSESGAGDLNLPVVAVESVTVSVVDGFSEIRISGRSKKLSLYNSGTGWIKAAELQCSEASVVNSSTGDCQVSADSSLSCSIYGIGNIVYRGMPALTVLEKTGKGRVIMER